MYDLKKSTHPVPYITAFTTSWRLASEAFETESKSYKRKQQWKSCWGVFSRPSLACKWFTTLKSPEFAIVSENRKRLYIKPFRVYISIRWNKAKRIKVILDTYKYILTRSKSLSQIITKQDGVEIARFNLNETIEGKLIVGYDERYRKEGELVFTFESEQLGGMVAAAACSFEEIEPNKWVTRIACIQGHIKNDDNYSKVAQKMLQGMRPKCLIVFAIQEFSRQLGFNELHGAGDAIQAYRKKHAIHLPWRHAIHFDYDSVWSEIGGVPDKDGWFKLPIKAVQKDQADIKTHKRALYRRRYAILDDISLKIQDQVNVLLKD